MMKLIPEFMETLKYEGDYINICTEEYSKLRVHLMGQNFVKRNVAYFSFL
jgi:hypothetical protein